jgi:MoaA/NifB/PqqE/SkfB family radical SAM enzyme
MDDCKETGTHMTQDVFNQTMEFIKATSPLVLLISGGEPTEHPHFLYLMRDILKIGMPKESIVVTSNGMFLEGEFLTQKIIELGVNVQITNDERYYPQRIKKVPDNKLFMLETHIRTLYPQGRAVKNGFEASNVRAPKCFNLRSIANNELSKSSLATTIHILEFHNKFCSPSISAEGFIYPGESRLCNSVGTVYDDPATIFENIKNLNCNKCGMENNLTKEELSAIHTL